MTKQIFYLIVVLLGLMLGRIVNATESMQMTMTLKPDGEVVLIMAGSGTVTIDWGDRTASETHPLFPYAKDDWQIDWLKYAYTHAYSRKSVQKITITGANITHLECNRLGLTSLDVSENASLSGLYCHENQLTSLYVRNNTALTELNCGYNLLASLDISTNTLLSVLHCNNNRLLGLDVSNNIALRNLYCSNNNLMSLNVSDNTALTELRCWNTQLSSLDVSNNTALTYLDCWKNQIASLDVSKNIGLEYLYCSANPLTSLDVTNNTALIDLRCRNNQLTRLDVSKNIKLKELHCPENQLTDLDVNNNTALINLFCSDNQLTYFGVSHNSLLARLDCSKNQLSSYALNALFITLHSDTISEEKRMCILNNQGTSTCNWGIAAYKGWMLFCPITPVRIEQEKNDTIIFAVEIFDRLNFDRLHSPPLFKGKEPEVGFREYVAQKTVYPSDARMNYIQGIVLVEFDINLQGKVENVKLIQSVHPLLDAEALRVMRLSPKWTPAIQRGKKVKVKYVFPFNFKLT